MADQLNLRNKVTQPTDYKAARKATAEEMRTHPDEYKPFISDSDEHMAGIINKEAGTLNSEQAQQSESACTENHPQRDGADGIVTDLA